MSKRQIFQELMNDADKHLQQVITHQGHVKKVFEELHLHTESQTKVAHISQYKAALAMRRFHEAKQAIEEMAPDLLG